MIIYFMAAHSNGQAIIFCSCGFYLSSLLLLPRLIKAVGDWMSTILPHTMWSILFMIYFTPSHLAVYRDGDSACFTIVIFVTSFVIHTAT